MPGVRPMRLDKYLKVSRLVKRRTVAKEMCAAGRVAVNYRPAKPGMEVKVGDIITITRGDRKLAVEILSTPESVSTTGARETYRILTEI